MKELNCIMLIDDDETTNFYNEDLISEMEVCNEVRIALNGQEALDMLVNEEKESSTSKDTPDLILLDINMPVMDGFEFMEAYEKLIDAHKGKVVIIMLTTSLSVKDREKAKGFLHVSDYLSKPLQEDDLRKIIEKHF